MDAGGARGHGRGRGRGRGRGCGRGAQADSDESAVPSVATALVAQSVLLAEEAGVGIGGGARVGAAPGAGAAPAHGLGDQVVELLMQLLARFPPVVPEQAQVAPPVGGAQQDAAVFGQQGAAVFGQPGAVFVGQHDAAVVGHPPYLEMMGQMQRINTLSFEGRVGPVEADEWRQRLERNFQPIRCPEEYRVELAVHYLGGDAHLWWRAIQARRAVWTWGEFLAEFNAKFFPQEARDRLQMSFLSLSH